MGGGTLLALAPGSARACANEKEVVEVVIDEVEAPFTWSDGTYTFAFQRFWVDSPIEEADKVDVPLDHDGRMEVVVCDAGLLPQAGADPCEHGGFATVAVWTNTYWIGQFDETAGAVHHPTVWLKGWYAAGATTLGPMTEREHRFYALRVQPTQPGCGMVLEAGGAEDPMRILDNPGMGILTQQSIGTNAIGGIFSDTWQDGYDKAAIKEWLYDEALVQGPPYTTAKSAPQPYVEAQSADDVLDGRSDVPGLLQGLPGGPRYSSSVMYVKGEWDMLWHGTCLEEGTQAPSWCLPDDHPRLDILYHLDAAQNLIPASQCVSDVCAMGCPTASADPGEARYDFHLIEAMVEAAWETEGPSYTPGVGGAITGYLGRRQQVALHIAPVNPNTGHLELVDSAWSVPAFLADCADADEKVSGTDTLPIDNDATPDALSWTLVAYDSETFVEQHDLLLDALANGTDNVETSFTFAGYDEDPRFFSIDVGAVGSWAEWNQEDPSPGAATDYELVTFDFTPVSSSGFSYDPTTCDDPVLAPWYESVVSSYRTYFDTALSVAKFRYSSAYVEDCPELYDPLSVAADLDQGHSYSAWGTAALPGFGHPASGSYEPYDYLLFAEKAAIAGEDWRSSPYRAEIAYDFRGLIDQEDDLHDQFRYVDLDESVRLAILHHFSQFNLKNVGVPPWEVAFGDPLDPSVYDDGWCQCADGPLGTDHCIEQQLHRLLTRTGYRLTIHSAAIPATYLAGDDFAMVLRLENDGNAPSYQDLPLALRFHDPVAEVWYGPIEVMSVDARDVQPPAALCAERWADTTSTSQPDCAFEFSESYSYLHVGDDYLEITDVCDDGGHAEQAVVELPITIAAQDLPNPASLPATVEVFIGFVDANGDAVVEFGVDQGTLDASSLYGGDERWYRVGTVTLEQP